MDSTLGWELGVIAVMLVFIIATFIGINKNKG
jgi:hypothetical protein